MRASKGFTLIELAVVIAIIAILAAVAIPRFGDTTVSAERALIKDMVQTLTSSASIYTAENGATPNSFSDFVSNETTATKPYTMTLRNFGGGTCNIGGNTITGCTFKKWTDVTYNWNGGQITVTANGPTGFTL